MRADLPSGTVTFLFTDVEGSTRLLDEIGAEGYAEALSEHRLVVRSACAGEGGVEVDTQGDAFFFAFATAPRALSAAQAITEGLRAGRIQVRVGLHTGTPLVTEEGYIGPDVHRAARIASSGQGGQVILSASTAALVDARDSEPRLVDLGEHRFKDLAAPERVFQLGEGSFAPLRSLYRTNLPVPATSFLGREKELGEVVEALRSQSAGFLTLTGPGGTGKTRLAIHAAAEAFESYPDGIWWVPLAPLRNARRLVTSLAQALSVEQGPGLTLSQAVAARLDGTRALLVLDNAEHLLPEVAREIAQLRDIDGPSIVVTSRERLQLQGEHIYAVPPLADEDGVDLFVARARDLETGVEPSPTVGELCERLDNLPLALELAAARTIVFSPEQLLERLSDRLDLLKAGRDADPRQQTLRATIEWSHGLLDDGEQQLFRRLSVFAGGCTYEAAEAVCDARPDTMQSLVDKSLLRRSGLEQARFWMLETIGELAEEKLVAAGETTELRKRHAGHYLEVALSANLAVEATGPQRHDLVIPERDNMRAALAYALESGQRELGLELVVALENYWVTSAPEEGLEWAGRLLDGATGIDLAVVARAVRVQGGMQNTIGQLDESTRSFETALALHRRLGDELRAAILLHRLSNTAARRGDWAEVSELAEASLAAFRRSGGFPKGEAQALTSLAIVAHESGDLERALDLYQESRGLCEEIGFRWWLSGMFASIGDVLAELGRLDEARSSVQQGLTMSHAMRDRRALVYELRLLAEIEAAAGDERLAGVLFGAAEAERGRAAVGMWPVVLRSAMPSRLLQHADPEFDRGRDEGRRMELDAAVAVALGGDAVT